MPRAVGNLIAHPFVMRGRAMEDGYGSTPKACEQDASLNRWVRRGGAYARLLPSQRYRVRKESVGRP